MSENEEKSFTVLLHVLFLFSRSVSLLMNSCCSNFTEKGKRRVKWFLMDAKKKICQHFQRRFTSTQIVETSLISRIKSFRMPLLTARIVNLPTRAINMFRLNSRKKRCRSEICDTEQLTRSNKETFQARWLTYIFRDAARNHKRDESSSSVIFCKNWFDAKVHTDDLNASLRRNIRSKLRECDVTQLWRHAIS